MDRERAEQEEADRRNREAADARRQDEARARQREEERAAAERDRLGITSGGEVLDSSMPNRAGRTASTCPS